MDDKIIKQARALAREILYWSTLAPGSVSKKGITEFSFLAEVVVPRAELLKKLIKKRGKAKGSPVTVRRSTARTTDAISH